jgi:hypothetical protein
MFTQTMRRALPYGWVAVALAFLYLAGVFAIRHFPPVQLRSARATVPDLPGGYYDTDSKIAHFYANTGVLTRGEQAVICYGTRNVTAVALDPPDERIAPALNRCFAVSPKKTTTYTMSAAGTDGRQMSYSLTIQVNPPPPRFTMIAISAKEIVRGDRWSVCYSTENASAVRLEPLSASLPPGTKRCGLFYPAATMKLRLTAFGENGMKTTEEIPTVTVLPRTTPAPIK